MVIILEREKLHLLLDWVYQNYAEQEQTNSELIELIFNRETHGLQKSQIRKLFNGWVEENKSMPSFTSVERMMREKLRL